MPGSISEDDETEIGPRSHDTTKKTAKLISKKIDEITDCYLKLSKRVAYITLTILNLAMVIWAIVEAAKIGDFTSVNIIVVLVAGILLVIASIATVVASSFNYIYTKVVRYTSVGLWLLTFVLILASSLSTSYTMTTSMAVLVALLYIVLPVPMIWAVIGGAVTIIVHGCSHMQIFDHDNTHKDSFDHAIIISSEIVSLLAVNIFGAYIKLVTEAFHTRTFTETYDHIKARMVLEKERTRQEQLLLSIIPADLAHRMRQSMVDRLNEETGHAHNNHSMSTRRLWHDFHVREHKQVSILFADLVNFTDLTTKCSAKDLVSMLNEIYGRFDGISRVNDCMRIKTLGDCYCCVSGMPVSRPNHAENVVKAGLQMVTAIKSIRESTTCLLDMRIGVHSGNVLCGVLGTVKWKYDIWSEDVLYANFLETTGEPGCVHISAVTMQSIDADRFVIDKVEPPVVNDKGEEQETYLIYDVEKPPTQPVERRASFQRSRSFSSNSSTQQLHSFLQSWGAPKPFENLANMAVKDDKTPLQSCEILEASVDSTFFSQSLHQICDPRKCYQYDNHCCCIKPSVGKQNLHIINKAFSKLRSRQGLYLSIVLFVYFLMTTILNCLILAGKHRTVYIISGLGTIYIGFIIYFIVERWQNRNKKTPALKYSTIAYNALLVYTVIIHSAHMFYSHFIGNQLTDYTLLTSTPNFTFTTETFTDIKGASILLVLTRTSDLLMLLPAFLFIYTNFHFKLVISSVSCIALCLTLYVKDRTYFMYDIQPYISPSDYDLYIRPNGRSSAIAAMLYVVTVCVLSVYAKQTEYSMKALLMWKRQFNVENQEVETMKSLTKLLLTNILPQHVATYYLERQGEGELYHESYDNVCIMFASIVNFDEFFKMSGTYDKQHQCLRLLNEIIGDIDMLLSKPKFCAIEKMKTVGSTYMAAAGLQPGRDMGNNDEAINHNVSRTTKQVVQTMTDFALALFSILETINKNSFNNFRLRIGISHGPVIAGVVGAQKPQYDVWGDTVNMASRMDSGGIVDTIQMTANTGEILIEAGYPVTCRGKTVVKGKRELITTYLLDPLNNCGESLSSHTLRQKNSTSSM